MAQSNSLLLFALVATALLRGGVGCFLPGCGLPLKGSPPPAGSPPPPPPAESPPPAGPAPAPSPADTPASLLDGTGDVGFYYDVEGATCTAAGEFDQANAEFPACTSATSGSGQQTLLGMDFSSVVAIDSDVLTGNEAEYCGKQVILKKKDGTEVTPPHGIPFFVWDSCDGNCKDNKQISISLTAAKEVDPNICSAANSVAADMEWEILDTTAKTYIP